MMFFWVIGEGGAILRFGRCPASDVDLQLGPDGVRLVTSPSQQPWTDATHRWDEGAGEMVPLEG